MKFYNNLVLFITNLVPTVNKNFVPLQHQFFSILFAIIAIQIRCFYFINQQHSFLSIALCQCHTNRQEKRCIANKKQFIFHYVFIFTGVLIFCVFDLLSRNLSFHLKHSTQYFSQGKLVSEKCTHFFLGMFKIIV